MNMKLASQKFNCASHEHIAEFAYDNEAFYCMIRLVPKSFFRRIIHAIKYIFGYHSKFGIWDMLFFNEEELKRLDALIHDFCYDRRNFVDGEKTKVINDGQEVDLV